MPLGSQLTKISVFYPNCIDFALMVWNVTIDNLTLVGTILVNGVVLRIFFIIYIIHKSRKCSHIYSYP